MVKSVATALVFSGERVAGADAVPRHFRRNGSPEFGRCPFCRRKSVAPWPPGIDLQYLHSGKCSRVFNDILGR